MRDMFSRDIACRQLGEIGRQAQSFGLDQNQLGSLIDLVGAPATTIDKNLEFDVAEKLGGAKSYAQALAEGRTIDEIKEVIHAVQRAETSISDARYSSEEAKDQADNSISECDNADTYIGDAGNITNVWETKIRELEAVKVEADTEVTEEQKEINNSNQYQAINN